jgi:hypothetical protein
MKVSETGSEAASGHNLKPAGIHGHPGYVCYGQNCQFSPVVRGKDIQCRCQGEWPRNSAGKCNICQGLNYADWEWELLTESGRDWSTACQGNGWNSYGERCNGYAATDVPCAACGNRCKKENSAGFVETQDNEFPVEVTVYTRTHMDKDASSFVRISNVREDSITVEVRKGVRTLVFESVSTDRIAYVPFVEWYTTEVMDTDRE